MTTRNNYLSYGILFVAVIVIAVTVVAYMKPQDNSLGARVDRAAEDVSDGVKDAARELDPNRTPAEKVGDALEDAGDNLKDAVK